MSEVGDVADMSRNTMLLLSDETKLKQFRENAAAQAKKFDIHNIIPQYEDLYNRFLNNNHI